MGRKPYSNSLSTLEAVWQVLKVHASPEHPLTVGEICAHLKELEDPSRDTLKRLLPKSLPLMNALFPGDVVQEGAGMATDAYLDEGGLHIVVETPSGEVLARDGLDIQAVREPFQAPSAGAVTKLLTSGVFFSLNTFPFRLRCVAQVPRRRGGLRTLPYEDWEEELAQRGQARNNVPRRYYLSNCLSDAEWRLFSDLVLVYPFLSEEQTKRFLSALNRMRPQPLHIPRRFAYKRGSQRMMELIALLDQAIRERRKVRVVYGEYRLEQRPEGWRPVLRKRRKTSELEMEPYALMWSNGYYYLVARHRGMMNLRADRLLDVELLEERFTPPDLDLVDYRNRSPVMYPGESKFVRLRCRTSLLNTLLDVFGDLPQYTAPRPGPEGETTEVTMFIAPGGVKLFALEYAWAVEVLEPPELREDVARTLAQALEKYRPGEK